MIRYALLFLCLSISAMAIAQEEGFSTSASTFYGQLETYMKDTKRDDAKKTAELFLSNAKSGKVYPDIIEKIANVCNDMNAKKMRAYPYFVIYFDAVNAFATSRNEKEKFDEWQSVLDKIISRSKGSHQEFKNFMEFSTSLFNKGAIYESTTKSWFATNPDYAFKIKNDTVLVTFNEGNLIGQTKKDSVVIRKTKGVFFPSSYKWKGNNGKVDWGKVGLPQSDVYAVFDDYMVDIKKGEYTVENATFTYKGFLKQDLKGTLKERLKTSVTDKFLYPQFNSYDKTVQLDNLAEQVKYEGGFSLQGNNIIGYGDSLKRAEMYFYSAHDTMRVKAVSKRFEISKFEEINASDAEIVLLFGEDSIYHPSLNLKYLIPQQELRILRGERGLSKTSFYDSYHAMEFKVDGIYWNVDSSHLDFKMVASTSGNEPAQFESRDYFDRKRFHKYQNISSKNPLSELKSFYDATGKMEIDALRFAKALNKGYSVGTISNSLYKMMEDGFIYYDKDANLITLKQRLINYGLADRNKMDYDIIKIESISKNVNARLDFDDKDLDLTGVQQFKLSSAQEVVIFPRLKFINVHHNRNMEFNGTVLGGRIDFTGNDYEFNYDEFNIRMPNIDWMQINYPSFKMNRSGKSEMENIKTKIEKLTGVLLIDDPNNKSGKEGYRDYPKFESYESSYAYYDQGAFKNVYNRDSFYFELKPFKLDSLAILSPELLSFKGKLVSDGIFPDFEENLTVQHDKSLGFETETPPGGSKLFGNKGSYDGKIKLSNEGLAGGGEFNALSAYLHADSINFYPDSLLAECDTFFLPKKTASPSYPETSNSKVLTNWKAKKDTMYLKMKSRPFDIYENEATLKGNLLLSSNGLWGNGFLDWAEASLKAKEFKFDADIAYSDTADLTIKTLDTTAVAFATPDVSSIVNFADKTGEFKSTEDYILANLPYNKYRTTMSEFDWDMAKGLIDLRTPIDKEKRYYFESTNTKLEGLKFEAKSGLYNLNDYILKGYGIPFISIADAKVIPDSNKVTIIPGGTIQTLENATITTDTIYNYHKIYNATVDIKTGLEFLASGDYDYVSSTLKDQVINFDKITTEKEETDKDKKSKRFYTKGYGTISEEQAFKLDKIIDYKGNVELKSRDKFLTFDGYSKINLNTNKIQTQWFKFKDDINPDNIQITIEDLISEENDTLFVGISFDMSRLDMYTTFIDKRRTRRDHTFIKASGFIDYDPQSRTFSIGDEAKILGDQYNGNVLQLDDARNVVKTEGRINMGSNYGLVTMDAAGQIENDLTTNSFKINDLIMGMDFLFDEDMTEKLGRTLQSENEEADEIDFIDGKFQNYISELVKPKEVKEVVETIERLGYYEKSKDIQYKLFLTDLNMVFDTTSRTMISTKPFGIAYVGDKYVNRMVNGFTEFGTRKNSDFFNIFFETEMETWYYFSYKKGILSVLSSDPDFNNAMAKVSPKKRRTTDKKTNKFIQYQMASNLKKENFVARMKELLPKDDKK